MAAGSRGRTVWATTGPRPPVSSARKPPRLVRVGFDESGLVANNDTRRMLLAQSRSGSTRRGQAISGLRRSWIGRRWRWAILAVAGLIVFIAIAYVVLKLAPDWFAQTNGLDARGRADARQGVRTASLALLAGAVGVVGAVYTARGYALNRAGQLTDRFTKAIEQLGHKELDVRLGGIYALERIARDSRQDHPQVVEVLTAYVREHAVVDRDVDDPKWLGKPDTDVQAVLTVLGRRNLSHETEPPPWLNLPHTKLDRAMLFQARFRRVGLRGASLRKAYLIRADLSEAHLAAADLRAADLRGADLSGSELRGANLLETNLRDADLRDAWYDDTTAWPEGFDPRGAGARLEDSDVERHEDE
jgi:hypothetical protein